MSTVYRCNPHLGARAIDATGNGEVRALAAEIEREIAGCLWRPVGDIPFNDGPIELGKDAPTQLVERVVNAMEACFELEARRHPTKKASTPDEAAQLWFNVPARGLGAMPDEDVRALAERTVRVHLANSDDPDRPTVVVDDHGIGQHPSAFPTSLLSLHHSEKREKPYLIGKYGHGGATTLMYSEFTVIASRRAHDQLDGKEDLVGFTIVRYRQGRVKGGTYEYLCGPYNAILCIEASEAPQRFRDSSGTRVTHIGYDLRRYSAAYRQQKTGLWALFNSSLFDPPLPIHITGGRTKDRHGDKNAATTGRIIKGNAAVLEGVPTSPRLKPSAEGDEQDTDADDGSTRPFMRYSSDIDLDVSAAGESIGKIRVRVWVVGGAPNAESYVRPDQTITLSISGQKHGQRGRDFLRECKLGFLSKRMAVQVAADGLTSEARRHLFPSGREQQRDNEISDAVFEALADYLDSDDFHDLEEEAKNQELAKASAKVKDSVRRKVAKLIERHLAGSGRRVPAAPGGGALDPRQGSAKVERPRARRAAPQMDDSAFPAAPTAIAIVNAKHQIAAGKSGHLILSIDAKNGYLDDKSEELVVDVGGPDPGGLRHKGTGSIRGGRARLVFGTSEQTKIGEYVVRVQLVKPDENLIAVATIEIVEPTQLPTQEAPSDSGMPDINWLKHPDDAVDDDERARLKDAWPSEWTGKEVGDVTGSGGSLVFRLNESFPDLRRAVERRADGAAGSKESVVSLKDRYAGAVSFGMFLLNEQREKAPPAERPSEDWMRSSFIALGRVHLAMMLDADFEAD